MVSLNSLKRHRLYCRHLIKYELVRLSIYYHVSFCSILSPQFVSAVCLALFSHLSLSTFQCHHLNTVVTNNFTRIMRKVAFFSSCLSVLVLLNEFRAPSSLNFKFGIIVETCFNKSKKLEEKLNKFTTYNGSASVSVVDAPCGNIVAAKEQVCSLIKSNTVNIFVALATDHLLRFYELAFYTLRSSSVISSNLKTIISDIADEFEWNNIFIYVDKIYDDVMPECSHHNITSKSCRSVMVWTNVEPPEAFINQTLFYKDGRRIVRKGTNHYVLILTGNDTEQVIKIAQKKDLFNFYTDWLIFAGVEVNEILRSLKLLTYNSNVYVTKIRSEEASIKIMLDLISIRNEWINNHAGTHGLVQNSKIKYVCGDVEIDSEVPIYPNITSVSPVYEIFEVIPTRFDTNPSLHLLGQWSINANPRFQVFSKRKIPNFEGATLRVATLHVNQPFSVLLVVCVKAFPFQSPPYVIIEKLHSSDKQFSGYLVDLLNISAQKLNFTYDLYAVEDNVYGENTCDNETTCSWSGIIGALMRKEAHIGLANLTPLPDRAKEISFLHTALANGGFKMIYAKPSTYDKISKLKAYVRPFNYRTWICIVSLLLGMVFLLTANQQIKWKKSDYISKGFKINNPIFVAVQVLCQQGLEDTPKDGSSRIIFIIMWLFSLLVFASYAATLTSYFTTAELKLPIKNLNDFLKQTEYKMAFISASAFVVMMKEKYAPEEYRRLFNRLEKDGKNSFVISVEEGLERIKKEKVIFAHDSGTIKWLESGSCNLIVVGPSYMEIGVTIATTLDSEYYKGLDWVLRMTKETGLAQRLEKEYWGNKAVECQLNNNQFQSVSILTICAPLLILGF
uniref:Ionotropic glutamate receptor C-terminal domain-containing protein n=1 Tax=Strigamia maritima TaxID=126957 RepID=T1JAD4_STRMM